MDRKIRDLNKVESCTDPNHEVRRPNEGFEVGVHEHTCPACGVKYEFIVQPGSYLAK